jgi:hypothetical protein
MEYAIVALFFFAVWHFVYENILRPTIHVSQRNEFFQLRDELRTLEMTRPKAEAAAFQIVQEGLNNAINSVERLDLSLHHRLYLRYTLNNGFRKRVDDRRAVIDQSECVELKAIAARADKVLMNVFVCNSGGWFAYLVPVALLSIFYSRLAASVRELFTMAKSDADDVFRSRMIPA